MGESRAGSWVALLVVYFAIFIFTVHAVASSQIAIMNTTNLNASNSLLLGLDATGGTCDVPRLEPTAYSNSNRLLTCKYLVDVNLVYDNASCSSYNGCTWETKTAWWDINGIFQTSVETCTGNINATYYNANNPVDTAFSGSAIAGFYSNVCNGLSNLSQSGSMCQSFGCTWATMGIDGSVNSLQVNSFWDTIKALFTFQTDIGLDSYNWIFNLFFFWIPLILLIIALYFCLPFLH